MSVLILFLALLPFVSFSTGIIDYHFKSRLKGLEAFTHDRVTIKILDKNGNIMLGKMNFPLRLEQLPDDFTYLEAPRKLYPQNDIVRATSYVVYGNPGERVTINSSGAFRGYLFRDAAGASLSSNCYFPYPSLPNYFVCTGPADISSPDEFRLVLKGVERSQIQGGGKIYLTGTLADGSGKTGRGVVVGVVDSGINFCHPAFLDGSGRTRVRFFGFLSDPSSCDGVYISDLEICEYDEAKINSLISSGRCNFDDIGHGTHVAGTAAGFWDRTIYNGIATEASLVVYRLTEWTDVDAMAGLRWIKEKAGQLNMPAVVNLSLGTHYGPHDGSSLFEQYVDNLSGPGFIIVVAAGNYGDREVHAYTTESGDSVGLRVNNTLAIEGWYEGGTTYRVEVCSWDLSSCTGSDPGFDMQGFEKVGTTGCSAFVMNSITSSPLNGDGTFLIKVSCSSPQTLKIRLLRRSGSVLRADMWITEGSGAFLDHFDREPDGGILFTVSSPATARNVISVGAFSSRPLDASSFNSAGKVAYFSSRGPTRDGRIKPNVIAGGYFLCSADSNFVPGSDPVVCGSGHYYIPQGGTSMAAPVVTGLVSLYLEDHPGATPEEVKKWLTSNALEEGCSVYPGVSCGSGKAIYSSATGQKGSGTDFYIEIGRGLYVHLSSGGGCSAFGKSFEAYSALLFLFFARFLGKRVRLRGR